MLEKFLKKLFYQSLPLTLLSLMLQVMETSDLSLPWGS